MKNAVLLLITVVSLSLFSCKEKNTLINTSWESNWGTDLISYEKIQFIDDKNSIIIFYDGGANPDTTHFTYEVNKNNVKMFLRDIEDISFYFGSFDDKELTLNLNYEGRVIEDQATIFTKLNNNTSTRPIHDVKNEIPTKETTSTELCTNIKTIIEEATIGEFSQDSTIFYEPVKDNKEAFKKAQILAVKMGAEPPTKKNDTLCYTLPEKDASVQYIDKKADECLYGILYLQTQCENFPLKEVHYMKVNCYKQKF